MLRRSAFALALVAAASCLTACGGSTVSLDPAPDANDPACAAVSVRLPAEVDGQPRRWTDAQATAAWGDPTAVLLSCGLTPPGPSDLDCGTIEGVDWIIDDSEAPRYRFTTFGRTPAVQVYLDYDLVSSGDVLRDVAPAVATLPSDGACTDRPGTDAG